MCNKCNSVKCNCNGVQCNPEGHPHAELMAQYAEDARETATPYDRWEYFSGIWCTLDSEPMWRHDTKYRRKPRVMVINGIEVPEPVYRPLKENQTYWYVDLLSNLGIPRGIWRDTAFDRLIMERGLVHLSIENAVKHSQALLSFSKQF